MVDPRTQDEHNAVDIHRSVRKQITPASPHKKNTPTLSTHTHYTFSENLCSLQFGAIYNRSLLYTLRLSSQEWTFWWGKGLFVSRSKILDNSDDSLFINCWYFSFFERILVHSRPHHFATKGRDKFSVFFGSKNATESLLIALQLVPQSGLLHSETKRRCQSLRSFQPIIFVHHERNATREKKIAFIASSSRQNFLANGTFVWPFIEVTWTVYGYNAFSSGNMREAAPRDGFNASRTQRKQSTFVQFSTLFLRGN